jgi:hypothetical protein
MEKSGRPNHLISLPIEPRPSRDAQPKPAIESRAAF